MSNALLILPLLAAKKRRLPAAAALCTCLMLPVTLHAYNVIRTFSERENYIYSQAAAGVENIIVPRELRCPNSRYVEPFGHSDNLQANVSASRYYKVPLHAVLEDETFIRFYSADGNFRFPDGTDHRYFEQEGYLLVRADRLPVSARATQLFSPQEKLSIGMANTQVKRDLKVKIFKRNGCAYLLMNTLPGKATEVQVKYDEQETQTLHFE